MSSALCPVAILSPRSSTPPRSSAWRLQECRIQNRVSLQLSCLYNPCNTAFSIQDRQQGAKDTAVRRQCQLDTTSSRTFDCGDNPCLGHCMHEPLQNLLQSLS